MNPKLNIIFMGTPAFAVPALEALYNSKHHISLVLTQPDRPKGRGRQNTASPVKIFSQDKGLALYQPETLKAPEILAQLKHYTPDLFVVVAYGHILPPSIIALAQFAALNIHASLLPKYRGPAPIQWAIINQESETGVTIMQMDAGLDTGDILVQSTTPILSDDTASILHDRLSHLGAKALIHTLDLIQNNRTAPRPQDHAQKSYAPMLKKQDGHIDWRLTANEIDARVKGLTPWPGVFTFLDQTRYKIFKTVKAKNPHNDPPGTVIQGFSSELRIACGQDALSILEIQGASGKRMKIEDFLRGAKIPAGSRFH